VALLAELRRGRLGAGSESPPLGGGILAVAPMGSTGKGGPRGTDPGTPGAGGFLPGASGEVRWLKKRIRSVRLCRSAEEFLKLLERGGFQGVHIAAHARVDDQNPWRSEILIPSEGGESTGVGFRLQAYRIAGSRMPPALVMLTSCSSALGRLTYGEGVLGLASAFLSAGAPAVVATLWPIDDEAAYRLVRFFYEALAGGRTVSDALREAQTKLARSRRYRHPFYWAGFIVVGEGERTVSLELRRRWGWVLMAILVLAAVLGSIFLGLDRWQGDKSRVR